ncbi:transposase IS111A/IS1328/IS1533 [Burkholderia sp. BT03]|nr:transposase IS111A/IS1328/IS1533 [Burkholderia sp. BT03]SKD08317.1 Transposase [Paraburkholderia hospita]
MSGKRGKNDAADAAAICEAVTRPSMRFVPLKDEHQQQATLCLHRTRQGFVEERTATYNRLRGLLSEFGVVLPQSPEKLRGHITEHLDTLPGWAKHSISDLLEHAGNIEDRLIEYDRAIAGIAREDARSKRLMQLRGIGPTTASALLASIGALRCQATRCGSRVLLRRRSSLVPCATRVTCMFAARSALNDWPRRSTAVRGLLGEAYKMRVWSGRRVTWPSAIMIFVIAEQLKVRRISTMPNLIPNFPQARRQACARNVARRLSVPSKIVSGFPLDTISPCSMKTMRSEILRAKRIS